MKKIKRSMAFAAAFTASSFASAAYIGVDSSGPNAGNFVIPDTNDYATGSGKGTFVPEAPLYVENDTALFGQSLVFASNEKFKLTFTFLGFEAGWRDVFLYDGVEIFDNSQKTTVGNSYSTIVTGNAGEHLNFGFATYKFGNSISDSVANDAGNGGTTFNFLISEIGEDFMVLSLDDNNRVDDNHDDMLIKLTATEVPEPGTLALLGLGLAGIALRRKAKKTA